MVVDRRALWLGGVLVVAIVAVMAVRSMNESPPARTTPRPRPAAARAGEDTGPQTVPEVNLAVLARERGEPAGPGRNPFRFQPKPPPAPPPVTLPPPNMRPGNQTAGGPVMPTRPVGPPPPPPIPLKFLGSVGKIENGQVVQIAILSDGRGPIYGREGEEIAGQYRILKIGVESIEMAYLDGRGRQTIPMSGEK
jgi:hypothetical protein